MVWDMICFISDSPIIYFFLVCLQNTIVRIESVFFRQIILRVFWQIKTNFYRNWIEIIFRSHSCKCCLKIEELKLENLWTKHIYFWSHTLTDWKSKSWNGKRTFQTTSKMNFRHLLGKSDIFRSRLLLSSSLTRHVLELTMNMMNWLGDPQMKKQNLENSFFKKKSFDILFSAQDDIKE